MAVREPRQTQSRAPGRSAPFSAACTGRSPAIPAGRPAGRCVARAGVAALFAWLAAAVHGEAATTTSPSLFREGLSIVGHLGGRLGQVQVSGDRVYASSESGLQVFSIADSEAPALLGEIILPSPAGDLAVSGSRVIAVDSHGLAVIDVSDPRRPVEIGRLNGSFSTVAVSGTYAFLTWGTDALYTADVGDPTEPRLVASAHVGGNKGDIAIVGDRALVTATDGLHVVDVSDPLHVEEVAVLSRAISPRSIAVQGDLAVIANGPSGVWIIDIGDPDSPTHLSTLDTPGMALDVAFAGRHVLVADDDGRLRVIDLSDPAVPVEVASLADPPRVAGVAVSGDRAFLGGWSGLRVLDVESPASPLPLGTYDAPGAFALRALDVSGKYAFLADGSRLRVVDFRDPAEPVTVGRLDGLSFPRGMDVVDGRAYVAEGIPGVRVIDVGDPTRPTSMALLDGIPAESRDVAASDAYLLVAAHDRGLQIADVSDPSRPVTIGAVDTSDLAGHVAAYRNLALLGGTAGLHVIDITTPQAAAEVGFLSTPRLITGLAVSRGHAFLAAEAAGFRIVDLADPRAPVEVWSTQIGAPIADVAVSGDYAFVGNLFSLRVFDVTDPSAPILVAELELPGGVDDVVVAGGRIYLSEAVGGLYIAELTLPGDADGDGLPDAWERIRLGTLARGPQEDPDQDGFTNLEEHGDGTDPAGPDVDIRAVAASTGETAAAAPVSLFGTLAASGSDGCGPTLNAARGDLVAMAYEVFNPHRRAVDAKLETTLCIPRTGAACDVRSDLVVVQSGSASPVTAEPGLSLQRTSLRVAESTPAGFYDGIIDLRSPYGVNAVAKAPRQCPALLEVGAAGSGAIALEAASVEPSVAVRDPHGPPGLLPLLSSYLTPASLHAFEIRSLAGAPVAARLTVSVRKRGSSQWSDVGPTRTVPLTPGRATYSLAWFAGELRRLEPEVYDLRWTLSRADGSGPFGVVERPRAWLLRDRPDADSDGLPDDWEGRYFGSATAYHGDSDADGDGATNAVELAQRTDPDRHDTDGDGAIDGVELDAGSDPRDASSVPADPPGGSGTPVIFIPGIVGSRLEGDGTRLPPESLSGPLEICDFWLDQFACSLEPCASSTGSAAGAAALAFCPTCPDVAVDGLVDTIQFRTPVGAFTADVYGDVLRFLRRTVGAHRVFPFAYDWRRRIEAGPDNAAEDLERFVRETLGIDCEAGERVDIVAHSMGGLVAKAFLARGSSRRNERCVRNLVTIGTPHLGTAYMLGAFLDGEDEIFTSWLEGLMDADRVSHLVASLPGAYQLLPSRALHERRPVYQDASRGVLAWHDVLGTLDRKQVERSCASQEYSTTLYPRDQIASLVGQQAPATAHEAWDVWTPRDPGLAAYALSGRGVSTVERFVESGRNLTTTDGDGRVPRFSAEAGIARGWTRVTLEPEAETVILPGGAASTPAAIFALRPPCGGDTTHAELPNHPRTRAVLEKLLTGSTRSPDCMSGALQAPAFVETPSAATVVDPDDRVRIALDSATAVLEVFDALGRSIGAPRDTPADSSIPTATFSSSGDRQEALVPEGATFLVRIEALASGSAALSIARTERGPIHRFEDVSLASGDVATLVFSEPNPEMVLAIDRDGDGESDAEVRPRLLPVAEAGDDRVVFEGTRVQLRGRGTGAPSPEYRWVQSSGPPVTLRGARRKTLGFTAPEVDEDVALGFDLSVSSGGVVSEADTVVVTVRSRHEGLVAGGGGDAATDCFTEWSVENPANPGPSGHTAARQKCLDGDAACDFDPAPGVCEFRLQVCARIDDPRLFSAASGGRACSAGHLGPIEIIAPSEADAAASPVAAANRAALMEAIAAVQPGAEQVCSPAFSLRVPLRSSASGLRRSVLRIRTEAIAASLDARDTDKLTLTCMP